MNEKECVEGNIKKGMKMRSMIINEGKCKEEVLEIEEAERMGLLEDCYGEKEYGITINGRVIYMAPYVRILMRENPLQGPLEGP